MQSIIKKSKVFFQGAGFLLGATVLVNLGNYALNLFLGRHLGPAAFAEANLLATLVMIFSFIAVGLQLMVAKFTAEYKAENNTKALQEFFHQSINTLKRSSIFLAPVCLLLTPFIQSYVRFESIFPLLILFLGFPFYLLMSMYRGFYQGTDQFSKMALSYFIEMIARVAITLGLIFSFSSLDYNIEIVALGFLASFVICLWAIRFNTEAQLNVKINKEAIIKFLLFIGIYEASQILINNADIILVKHFFEAEQAGWYASIALIGKVVYFATWSIVMLLFPKVIEKEKKGENHQVLFWAALAFVAFVGLSITVFSFVFDQEIIALMFGEAYTSSAHLLWKYSAATCLFACANVFAYYHLSLNNYIPVFISLFIGGIQILGVYFMHNNLDQVIMVQIMSMAFLLCSMIGYQFYYTFKTQNTLVLNHI